MQGVYFSFRFNHSYITGVTFSISSNTSTMATLKGCPDSTTNTVATPFDEDNVIPISHGNAMNMESVVTKPVSDHHRSYTSVMQGLTLDLNEPWERSLSRLLDDVSNTNELNGRIMNSTGTSHRTASIPIMTSPTSTVQNMTTTTAAPELMLLSRTDSRDYALEIEGDSGSSSALMNLSMDDTSTTTTSSSVVSQGDGHKTTNPIRSHSHPHYRNHPHHIGSIYRKTLSKKQLTTAGRKSLFDDSDNDDESDDTAPSGKCRLTHKFSSDSLFLFFEQQQQQQQQNLEDRGEQEDESDRRVADENLSNQRSFSIRKASAICDDNEYDNDDYYASYYSSHNYSNNNNHYFDAQQLFIPDHRVSRRTTTTHQYPPSDLYLPTF